MKLIKKSKYLTKNPHSKNQNQIQTLNKQKAHLSTNMIFKLNFILNYVDNAQIMSTHHSICMFFLGSVKFEYKFNCHKKLGSTCTNSNTGAGVIWRYENF